ncbi:DUF1801 domain-containing protein [Nonomuraea sp. NPDC050556]|uniref:DUF1801 domain-containing protein n=1 Tax=Nonomuraea sp. NPDC050556 TaxID=3364369 RepID=UPI00378EF402
MTVTEYAAALPTPLREIGETLTTLVDQAIDRPGAVWHGHPVWSLGAAPGKTPVVFFKAYSSYVTFGLWRGQEIDDPSGRLRPASRQMAAVKLSSLEDIDADLFTTWVRQAVDLEK